MTQESLTRLAILDGMINGGIEPTRATQILEEFLRTQNISLDDLDMAEIASEFIKFIESLESEE